MLRLAVTALLCAAVQAQPTDLTLIPGPVAWTGKGPAGSTSGAELRMWTRSARSSDHPSVYRWGVSNTSALSSIVSGTNPANGQPIAANGNWRAGDTFVQYATGFSTVSSSRHCRAHGRRVR